jgi:hypothetical protein
VISLSGVDHPGSIIKGEGVGMATQQFKRVQTPQRAMPDLRASVDAAIAAMEWLTPTDVAMADLARSLAEQIEAASARAELLAGIEADMRIGDMPLLKRLQRLEAMCDVAKSVGWLGGQLQGVLKDLGGAPQARKAMLPDQPVGGRLAQLRADAAKSTKAAARRRPAAGKHDPAAVDAT